MEDVENQIACSYKEVLTIISLLSRNDWDKIPNERKNFYFENMNKNYNFNFDISKRRNIKRRKTRIFFNRRRKKKKI